MLIFFEMKIDCIFNIIGDDCERAYKNLILFFANMTTVKSFAQLMTERKRQREASVDKREVKALTSLSRLELITQSLKTNTDLVLKCTDGSVHVSQVILTSVSEVFKVLLADEKVAEIPLSYPTVIIQAIVDWIPTSANFDCKSYDEAILLQMLKFANEFKLESLTKDIESYYNTNITKGISSIVNTVLRTYGGNTVSYKVYNMALDKVISTRKIMYQYTTPCSGEYSCRNDNKCSKHINDTTRAEAKQYSEYYGFVTKELPLQAHQDLIAYEFASLANV